MAKPEVSAIGKYQILERLATGDLAEVFQARLEGIAGFRRLYAIKRVRPHLARNETYSALLEEEARVAALLSHGNIVQILDLGRDGGALYLVMEHVDGWDLGRVLERAQAASTPMPAALAAWMGVQMLRALEYAQKREVVRDGVAVPLALVHRDVSPSNILLSRAGEVKLTDFGIARASLKMMETHPDLVRRTFDYMSPEAARGRDVTGQSDLFAVGVVLYEAVTLVHPFRREGEFATLEAIQDGACAPVVELRPEVPVAIADVIGRAMSVDPAARFADAQAMKEALEAALHEIEPAPGAETLSAWLRELFGEPALLAPVVAPIGDEPLEDLPAEPDATVPATHGADDLGLGDFEEEAEDQRTVVMGDAPAALRPMSMPAAGEEDGATVINADAAAKVEALRSKKGLGFESGDATRVRPELARALAQRKAAQEPAVGSGAWVAGVVSGTIALLIGALLGALLTVVYVRSGGLGVNDPVLDVRPEPGVTMTVTVDGESMSGGARQLAPGNHAVRVEVEGAKAWEFDLTLQAGEYRLMVLTANGLPAPK